MRRATSRSRPPVDECLGKEVDLFVNVEIAREPVDCVGVDAALVFARQESMDACVARDATLRPESHEGKFERQFLEHDCGANAC